MFKTNPVSLKELLDSAGSGKIQLPDFQRGWVWGRRSDSWSACEHIARLPSWGDYDVGSRR